MNTLKTAVLPPGQGPPEPGGALSKGSQKRTTVSVDFSFCSRLPSLQGRGDLPTCGLWARGRFVSGKSEWGCLQTLGPTQRPGAGKRQGSQWRVHIQLPSDAWAAASRPGSHHTGTSAPRAPALPTGTCPSRPCLAEACEGDHRFGIKDENQGSTFCVFREMAKEAPSVPDLRGQICASHTRCL